MKNKEVKVISERLILEKVLSMESKLVMANSMAVLNDFENIEYDY